MSFFVVVFLASSEETCNSRMRFEEAAYLGYQSGEEGRNREQEEGDVKIQIKQQRKDKCAV